MNEYKIGVIGLGYVGLPLAVEFSSKYPTVGYDIKIERIKQLKQDIDVTNEVDEKRLKKNNSLFFTSNIEDLCSCNIFIITVPTPIDSANNPNLKFLVSASEMIGAILKKEDIVIYESTVYPGCTEQICVPILEKYSNLHYNIDFFCGYSPERMNPGDKEHTVTKIVKVTSGSNTKTANLVDNLYKSIVEAGTHKVSSIKVAEASKIIENCQRDINIAFINELAILFDKLDLDTKEVLDAANTKWNFLNFRPGLVGGHCIGVDPYYLTYLADEVGYKSKIILAGRKLNDSMPKYISDKIFNLMKKDNLDSNSKILMLGVTFKENCSDIRNSKAIDICNIFKVKYSNINIYDPYADIEEVFKITGIKMIDFDNMINSIYDVIIVCVAHNEFIDLQMSNIKHSNTIIYDLKSIYDEKYERL